MKIHWHVLSLSDKDEVVMANVQTDVTLINEHPIVHTDPSTNPETKRLYWFEKMERPIPLDEPVVRCLVRHYNHSERLFGLPRFIVE